MYIEDQVFSLDIQNGHEPMCVTPSYMSDHHPTNDNIFLDNLLDRRKEKNTSFKLNTSLLTNEDNDEAVKMMTNLCKLWNPNTQPRDKWNILVDSWRKIYHIIGKKHAIDRKEEE